MTLTSSQVGQVVVHELQRQGVQAAVVSPGSRSAPIALAMAAHMPAGLHVRIDERTAAFLALGLARASGDPVAVTCSSGTATANYLPAVVEADAAGVPLVVVTADRPPELRGTGANQTIDQVGLYGRAVRFAADVSGLGGADDEGYLRRVVAQAVAHATGPWPGPVHLNLPLREPLLDDPADRDWIEEMRTRTGPGRHDRVAPEGAIPSRDHADSILSGRPTLVVVGEGATVDGSLLATAERLGMPVLAEPTSGLRRGTALRCGHWLAATPAFVAANRPEVVIQLGRPVLSRAVGALVAQADEVVTLDPLGLGWDPGTHTTRRFAVGFSDWLVDATPGDPAFLTAWRAADEAAGAVLDEVLDTPTDPTGMGVARDLATAMPAGGTLVVASSLAVRNLNEAMRPRELRILGNRGASGIDGFTSTAIGVAIATEGPTAALAGDLSIVHDLTGLVMGPDEQVPTLPIVVVNNDGGGIFDLLPYGTRVDADTFRRVFVTPHGLPLHGIALTMGHGYAHVDDPAELAQVLQDAWATPGITLIEVSTVATEETALHRDVGDRIRAALG